MSATAARKSVYAIVTEQIINAMNAGEIPWRKPWKCNGQRNLRGTSYRGINQIVLSSLASSRGYEGNVWMTFNQAKAAGGCVRKGEKGTPVVFWKPVKKAEAGADGTTTEKGFMLLRYYTVFHVSQVDGVTVTQSAPAAPVEPIAACESLAASYLTGSGPTISHGGDRAAYSPTSDAIRMPPRASFTKSEEYYSTLFHEMGHSTGHGSRLNRKGVTDPIVFGSHTYGQEELVAEFTAAFLCGHTGIAPATVENSAAYLAHWRTVIKGDEKMVVMAAAQAQKAADCIIGAGEDDADEEDGE